MRGSKRGLSKLGSCLLYRAVAFYPLDFLPGRRSRWAGPHRWPRAGKAWIHRGSLYPGTTCPGIQEGSGRSRRSRCPYRGLHSGTGQRPPRLGRQTGGRDLRRVLGWWDLHVEAGKERCRCCWVLLVHPRGVLAWVGLHGSG